jgi:DNA-binding winged helix-turn-helix (wHTH) protein
MASREAFHFDEFALDVGERRLLSGTETVRLSPKAYDVLVVLVRQWGRLVTKDELLAQVWPESFVEEGILNVHVAALRKALGDDTRPPAYRETVVRSGYRFIAAVRFDSGDDKPFAPDEAFDCLDQAIAYRDPALVHLAVAPDWDSLRDDPRFAQRLRLMAFPSVVHSNIGNV